MIFWFCLFIFVGIITHEFIHAIAYLTSGIKRGNIKFGVIWTKLMPYTYCSESMPIWKYWYALILPNFIFFVITIITLYYYNSHNILFFASLAILFGGIGDIYVIFITRKIPYSKYVVDSLTKIGCEIV